VGTEVARPLDADSLVRQTFSDIYDVVPCVIEELLVLLSRPKETAWGAQTFRSSLRSALCALRFEH
jgi:hypothetical protein